MMSHKTERALFRTLLMLIQCQFVILQQPQCLVTDDNNSPPAFPSPDPDNDRGYGAIGLEIRRQQQAIFASYRLNCCGNITEWGVDVNSGVFSGPTDRSGKYSLDLQVWRPSPTVDDSTGAGCYSLVGNNRFIAISSITSPGVAIVTPSPQDYNIPFQLGDVLGVYVEDASLPGDGVVVLTTYSTIRFTNDLVWYASIAPSVATSQNGDCPYSVGSNGGVLNTLVQGAPVISISTSTYSCPPPTSMATTQATTQRPTPHPNSTTDNEEIPSTTTQQIITMSSLMPSLSGGPSSGNMVFSLITSSSGGPSGGPSNENMPVPTNNVGAIVAPIVVSVFIMILIATVVIIAIVVKFKKSAKKGVSNPAHAIGTKIYRQTESSATYECIRDESSAPTAAMARRSYRPPANRNKSVGFSTRMFSARELYHKLGPNAGEGGATNSAEIELRQVEVGHSTLPHVYHYLESIMSQPGGVQNTREGWSPVNGKSPSHEPASYEAPQQQVVETDVFDGAGIYVPTAEERANLAENHYQLNQPKTYNKLKFFVKDQIYWTPASTTSDLYSQLASKKYREIPRHQLFIQQQRLGSGQFGDVSKALWCISGTTKELAIKTLKPGSKEEEKVRFLQEAAIMGQFSHPNVVKLYGVVTVGEPIMLCVELMDNGDLSKYLRSIVPSEQNQKMLEKQFLQFSRQIASGMKYLSLKSFVHRDLAARNILLDKYFTCKIGDFGLARDLMNETYYTPKASGGMIPVKWTAPEALLYKKYSTDSDVWSYGMVLFEIWSVGKKPFSQHSNNQVLSLLQTGHCQPPPPGCPRAIYKLMVDCWNKEHQLRPSFDVICTYLQQSVVKLLYCSRQDAGNVNNLGAELEKATQLYVDLQESHVHYEVK